MKQRSFVGLAFDQKKKKTRREAFLEIMERVVPWTDLTKLIEPHYPKAGNGRPPMPLERMLRIYCCQLWFNLSDPAMEDSLYDMESLRRFVGIELNDDAIPDETTILKFRHLLERHALTEQMFNDVNLRLEQHGLLVRSGSIVDATLIAAPPSTKNEKKERDPEMHQTKKGNQWYFGMKVHVGTDTKRGLVHSLVTTAANVHDSQMMDNLLHGEEEVVYGDSAYASAEAKEISEAQDIRWRVQHKAAAGTPLTKRQQRENKSRSKVRALGEHAFLVVKHLWGHRKVRYRGLKKNTTHYFACFSLANLYKVRHQILRIQESYVW
jgi:IS5 family transposase